MTIQTISNYLGFQGKKFQLISIAGVNEPEHECEKCHTVLLYCPKNGLCHQCETLTEDDVMIPRHIKALDQKKPEDVG